MLCLFRYPKDRTFMPYKKIMLVEILYRVEVLVF